MPHLGQFTKKKHARLTAQEDLHTPKLHASRHEAGGADEIDISGLTPGLHASRHEAGGADEIEFLKLTDRKHAAKHEDGGDDAIDASKLDKMLKIIPYNGKIADINHADTNKHTLDLETALSETRKILQIQIKAGRISGSGGFLPYPNEGSEDAETINWTATIVGIKDGTQRLQYKQSVANDDWDLYCLGYIVEA